MSSIYLRKLKLSNYRNFQDFEISSGNNSVIIIGDNGSGKTNILEAISLFSPGKGLRSAKLDEVCKREENYCSTYGLLESKLGPAEIITTIKRDTNRRFSEFNGSKISNNELSKFSSMVWLTPQMDGIFASGLSERRKFLDRIVYNFIPSHAKIVSKYEYYLHERIKLLEQEKIDANWLGVIEEKIAELSVEIIINRLKIIEEINKVIEDLDNNFPKAILSIDGPIEENISNNIDFIKEQLLAYRNRDKVSNRTNFGAHKSDFMVTHKEKNALAKFCSTGEQKSMLISIILAQVNYSIKANISLPILLLDEIFVHLDEKRRDYLIEYFLNIGLQTWITATDLNGIEKLAKKAEVISCKLLN
ncbi:MAG: DNA replication/repair protein RecF [Candidatus Rickettsia vulgarisii]